MPKRKIIILIAAVVFLIVGSFIYFLISKKAEEVAPASKEKTMEDKIKSVTAPERTEPLSKEEIQRIDELIKSATAPIK